MIAIIFILLFILAGVMAWRSLGDLKTPVAPVTKILRRSRKGLFGVINLPAKKS